VALEAADGSGVQVENKRACPSCGEQNDLHASFCWKCFAQFQPSAPGSRLPVPPAPTGGPILAPTTRSGRRRPVAIAAGVIAALIAFSAVRSLFTPSYHVPDALAGMQRIHDAQSDDFEQRLQQEGVKNDMDLESAVYGVSSAPRVYLVLANGQADEDTDALFREFLSGVEQSGATIERDAEVHGSHEGAEWRCVPVHAASLTAAVCMWREDAGVGMTLDLDPGTDVSGTLLAAYDASHA
jgi:hypothetical protein